MKYCKAYLLLFVPLFALFAVVFGTFPRSTFSELEKRELASFPEFDLEKLLSGTFTSQVSLWFSDSEPFRDQLMAFSMAVKDLIRLDTGEENITFHAAVSEQEPDGPLMADTAVVSTDISNPLAEENAKIANAGIIIVGSGDHVRALMAYGGSAKGCTGYALAANKYKETFPWVNVYCMVIPTAAEYYCPEKMRRRTNPQRPTIENVFRHLAPDVKPIDIYDALGAHTDEDIFLRTDHHWAPLGAFYAAQKFAEVAGVPFKPLSNYKRCVVHGYVGSMYGYSQDVAVKNAPEDFVYYVPQGVDYSTTYVDYTIDENYHVIGMGRPYKSVFFYRFKDGSGGAYCTFMGSDTKITCVRTSTHNGRRLMILKDSFGNALPGYLFFSFEEVHVIDSRYFTRNMVDYVNENHITDILFANNIFKAYSSHTYGGYVRFLTQSGKIQTPQEQSQTADSIPAMEDEMEKNTQQPVKQDSVDNHTTVEDEKLESNSF